MARQARARVSLSAPFALLVGAVRSPRRHGAATPTVHHHTCSLVSCAFQVVKAVAVTSDPSNSGLALHDPRSTLHTPHATHRALCPHPPTLEVRCSSPSHFPSLPHADMALARRVITESGMAPSRFNVAHAASSRNESTRCVPALSRGWALSPPSPAVASVPSPTLREVCALCSPPHVFSQCTGALPGGPSPSLSSQ